MTVNGQVATAENAEARPPTTAVECAELCTNGTTCIDGRCVVKDRCMTVRCTAESTCIDGICVPRDPCWLVRCSVGTKCIVVNGNATCAPTCTYDQECPCHHPCIETTCRDPCWELNCSSGTECKSVDGIPVCVSPPVKCSSVKDCPNDQHCLNGFCTNDECKTNDDCADNEQCYYAYGQGCYDPCAIVRITCANGYKREKHQCVCA